MSENTIVTDGDESPKRKTTTNNALVKSTPTGETTEAIREKYQEVLGARHAAVLKIVEFGNMLIEVKADNSFGNFGWYIEHHFPFSQRHAQRYMQLASELPKLKDAEATRVSHLSFSEAMRVISNASASAVSLDAPTRKKVLNTAEKKRLTIKEAERVVEARARKPKAVPAEREQSGVSLREAVPQIVAEAAEDDQVVGSEWEEVEDQQPVRWDYEDEVREVVCSWVERVDEREDLAQYLMDLANEIMQSAEIGGDA